MPSEAVNRATAVEWRELGFFYTCDDQAKEWRLVGSRAGLLRFRDLLLQYVADPEKAVQSEHEHYRPYAYLEVMTWSEPGLDQHALFGSLDDLRRLAAIVEEKLSDARPGDQVGVAGEFAGKTDYALVLSVREDSFDPASADPALAALSP